MIASTAISIRTSSLTCGAYLPALNSERLTTVSGKAFYAKRKSTVEPVFGIIKEVMGFRRFLLRGLEKVKGEWRLVCLAVQPEAAVRVESGGDCVLMAQKQWKSV